MAFPNLLKRLFDTDGAGIKLRGDIMPYGIDAPKAAGTAAVGTADTVARADHVHPAQTVVNGNAGSASKLETKRVIDGINFDGTANVHRFCTCSTAADTAAKTVDIPNFVLGTGAEVTVRFSVGNTADDPTLNVSGTGAKPVKYRNAAITAGSLAKDRIYRFVYDGADWELIGDLDTNTNTTYTAATAAPKAPASSAAVGTSVKYAREDHVHPLQTSVSGNAGSATKLATKRTIDGVQFDGTGNISHYATCSTAAATKDKVASLDDFSLVTGSLIAVRFNTTNTASDPTLNVNDTGARAIRYRAEAIKADYLAANRTYLFVYDGSAYELVGDIDTDTVSTVSPGEPTAPMAAVPVGGIIAFSGTFGGSGNRYPISPGSTAPNTNWVLCDGTRTSGLDVPDLRGRMIIGASSRYTAGKTGGSKSHRHSFDVEIASAPDHGHTITCTIDKTTLTTEQMPKHDHTVSGTWGVESWGWDIRETGRLSTAPVTTSASGASQPHTHTATALITGGGSHTHAINNQTLSAEDNLPPYYVLSYIMRVA